MTQSNNAVKSDVINYDLFETVDAHLLFPEAFERSEMMVRCRKHRHPNCLPSDENFVPDPVTLKRLLAWWHLPQLQPFGLTGPSGTGKTELLLYVADKLNEPVYKTNIHAEYLPEAIEGTRELVNGDKGVVTKKVPSGIAQAYRNGGLIIFDELDKANEALQAYLYPLLEFKPWTLDSFGVTLNKHPLCRITATSNTTGEGGNTMYTSSNRLDAAFRSRVGWFKTQYLEPGLELTMLNKRYKQIQLPILRRMVETANAFRDASLGKDRSGMHGTMNVVFSARTLVNWCHHIMVFGPSASLRESLDFVFGHSIDSEYIEDANAILQRIWGDTINVSSKMYVNSNK